LEEDDFYTATVAPFLEIITTIKMPFPIQSLEELLNIDVLDIRSIIKKLDMFIEIRDNGVMLVHKSVHDWLCSITLNDKYYISLNRGHKKICDFVISEFSKDTISEYVREFGFKHLAECGRLEKIAEIICNAPKDINTIFIKFATHMIFEGETDFLLKLFAVFATREGSASFIVMEVIKLLLQYGKKTEAENIVGSFDEGERKEQLKAFLSFYSAKVCNQNTSEIIEEGNAVIQLLKGEKIIAEILRILGDAYREKGHHEKAVELYREGKEKALEYKLDTIYLDCECALIDIEYVNGNTTSALKMLSVIKEKIDFKTPNIYTYKYYRLLGHIFHLRAEIPEAMNAFNECELIANKLSFPLKLIETYNSIGELQPTYNLGKDYVEKSRELSVHSGLNSLECGKSYYIEADLLLRNEQFEAALSCADRAIEILEGVGYGSGCSKSYLIKGKVLFELGQYDNAILFCKKASAYFAREQIYPPFRLDAYYFILKCASKLGTLNLHTADDSIDYFNLAEFPYLGDALACVKELQNVKND
jgi:tetratricopeptide (TPR) repeat protein